MNSQRFLQSMYLCILILEVTQMKCRQLMPAGFSLLLSMGMTNLASAQAQDAPPEFEPPAEAPEQALPETEFTDAELQSFVEVQGDLEAIRQEYTARLEETDDQAAVEVLQQEANQEMVAVVESNELDVDKYNLIARAIQQDSALLQRIQELME